jgi:hypothetical protein
VWKVCDGCPGFNGQGPVLGNNLLDKTMALGGPAPSAWGVFQTPLQRPSIAGLDSPWEDEGVKACYDSPLDPGIAAAVEALQAAGVETFESCEGGEGHAYPEPTVRFHGGQAEGFRALSAAMVVGLPVAKLRRVWPVLDNEPTGPWWELTFTNGR